MLANLYQAFIHFYAGRIDRVAKIVLCCWVGGCFMDWLMGKMTVGTVVWSLVGQLTLCALALTIKLQAQAREKKPDQDQR